MPRGLLEDGSPRHGGYSAINNNDVGGVPPIDQRTIEEAAAATRERLPGRSRKAKGRFRRTQRGQKGDEWRGRLSAYCEASSYSLEKVTSKLKEEQSQLNSLRSKLYSTRWRVKAHFDALHLRATPFKAMPILSKASSLRNMAPGSASAPESQHQTPTHDPTGYHTYDTEVSDGEGKGQTGAQDTGQVPDALEEDTIDIFVFAFGPVVFWGFNDEQDERETLRELREFMDGTFHDVKAADDASEELDYTYRDVSRIINDIVELATFKSGEKLSVSFAIAQSCHLSVHEWRLGQTINRNNHIPRELAETGIIQMSNDEISKEIGRLFVERNLINLEPELLE